VNAVNDENDRVPADSRWTSIGQSKIGRAVKD